MTHSATGPLLGFITFDKRNQAQHNAHAQAIDSFVPFPIEALRRSYAGTGPAKVILTDLWKDPLIIADIGMAFPGFHQYTGSCVGVSAGDAVATLSFVQRKLLQGPTKAFIPWWPFPYGRTRTNEGDHGQGEGAIDSVMAATLIKEGVFAYSEGSGLPPYTNPDGLSLPASTEMQYSDGASEVNTKYLTLGRSHLVGAAAVLNNTEDIKAAILNGYPVLDGCDDYIGHGSLSGDVALGSYDGRGGHSTCYLGFWDHPTQGPIFLYSNQWGGDTYPQDSSGKGRCCVWVKEPNVGRLFQLGGSGGECVALSHLSYFPAQPDVQSWYI